MHIVHFILFIGIMCSAPLHGKPRLSDMPHMLWTYTNQIAQDDCCCESTPSGFIIGPDSSILNSVPRFATTDGSVLKGSLVTIDDVGTITINGITKNGITVTWPSSPGAAGSFLQNDGAGNLVYATPAGAGNVSTASSFTDDNRLVRTDLASGTTYVQQSSVTLDDSNNLSGINTLNATTLNGNVTGNASSATTAITFTGPLTGDVTGNQGATVVSSVGGQTAASVAMGTLLANNATNTNTPNTIVRRDASGNFSAGTITANITGNATTATTATQFSGPLSGDVTGTQGATVVTSVGGQTAANVAAGSVLANAATSSNTPNTLVLRDGSGNFSADIITANLNGNATSATSTTTFSGSLMGDVTGTQGATVVTSVGGQTAANIANATIVANMATDTNTPNTIVLRDASGNFSAHIITADLIGNATTASTATSATTATTFSGSLMGDVTGTQGATVVSFVGGQSAANVANGSIRANNATNLNTPNTIVQRDASGDFSAHIITADLIGNATTATMTTNAINFSGALSGDVTGTQNATVVATVGGQTSTSIANAALLANNATDINTPNTLVKRDGSGNFSAHIITADLIGNATTATTTTNAINFSGALSGDVTGTQNATIVSTVGGQTASDVSSATIRANNATNVDTPDTLILRDASGNFSANVITASLMGNASTATSATNAVNATSFSGPLGGDVTGTQGATVVNTVGGQTATNIATATILANAATNINSPNTLIKRDASGNFSANIITADLVGNATTATTTTNAINFTGSLSGDVIGTQGATVVATVGGQTAAAIANATTIANAATNSNTANTIVKRDASGNFSANSITATLNGNANTATTATTAATATNFTGSLSGDVTGTQNTTVVTTVGGQTASSVASGTALANSATSANSANTLVRRDGSGNFSAGTITATLNGNALTATTATTFSGALNGDVIGTQNATVVSSVGGQAAANVASAAILAQNATDANTPNTLVLRDAGGNFSAGIITADLMGNATTATTATNALTTTNFSGSLNGDVTGTQNSTIVSTVGGQTATDIANATLRANAATDTNTPNALVLRDAAGNFSANTITATLNGNATTATTATSATNATNFTGSLSGDVTGTQNSTVVASVGGQAAADVALATISANAATDLNTPNAIVLRDASGNFSAGIINADLMGNATSATTATNTINFTGSLSGDVMGTQNATVVTSVGGQTATSIADATVLVNAATDTNTASTLVLRDANGDFSANSITASLIGAASDNVLKAGDSMTGNLTMLSQNAVRFEDASGGEYVGIHAPTNVSASYTLAFPTTSPTANQVLRAGNVTPTDLTWFTDNSSAVPASSKIIYVAKNGSDVSGNGSFAQPYATLATAIGAANGIASALNPIAILIHPGIYIENNSAGPLSITAQGISIVGYSFNAVIIRPSTPANDLLLANQTTQISNITLQSSSPTAIGISLTAGTFSLLTNMRILNFQIGVSCAGSTSSYGINNSLFASNGTAVMVNDTVLQINNSTIIGAANLVGPAVNTGVSITGSSARFVFNAGTCAACNTGFSITNDSRATLNTLNLRANIFDLIQTTSSIATLNACTFAATNDANDIDIQVSGAGTTAEFIGCEFNGNSLVGVPQATCMLISENAVVTINGGSVSNYTTGIQVGLPTDTSSTELTATALAITDCVTDLVQEGSATVNVNAGTASSSKIIINDPTNVNLAYFDIEANNALKIGSTADIDTNLIQAAIGTPNDPSIDYASSLYATQAIGFTNPSALSSSWFVVSNDDAYLRAITSDRSNNTGLSLFADEGSPIGGTSALRGWNITKNATTAELTFQYQNTISGQSIIAPYTVLQLDGANNQVQLPTSGTHLVFGGDTNLYRSAAHILKTDDALIIDTLTPNRVVITDGTKQLASSAVTSTELGFLAGTTASVQTQINSKVAKAGDTMTGTLQLPTGTTALPSLTFTGSTTTGLSANTNALSLSTNGLERLRIASGGTVSINGFSSAGVVHNDSSGNLSTSLIVNADIASAAAIADTKLATIATAGKVANSATTATSANTANALVLRDASGNFSASTITANLIGNVTGASSLNVLKAGDTMTGALTLPAGSVASPSLRFTGSTNTGLSAPLTNTLSFDTNGSERMHINAAGQVTINALATAGVVHTDTMGTLSTSLIVNTDITDASIENSKLAAISSANISDTIVLRDSNGDFAANRITLNATPVDPTDAATKDYVDSAISTGLTAKTPALVASTTNVTLSGLQTIDGVLLAANDRVLLVGQTNPIENGLWLAQAGAWTRPADFASGSTVGQAYVLVTSGTLNAGASWLSNTPLAIVDTDPIGFAQFSIPNQTTGANVGTGAGQIFKNKTGSTLNFKTIAAGPHISVTNNTNEVSIATDATSANTANTSVARDASGNFSAGTITANVTGNASGNVLKTGDAMSGTLNMLTQNAVRFQDATGGEYVGIHAPTAISSSYTLALPATPPLANQVLKAGAITPTDLTWFTQGGSTIPATSNIIYVSSYGNDITGNGSFDTPYATLATAIDTANAIATSTNPVAILIYPGLYVEDNSAGPLTVNTEGISIVGTSAASVIISPTTASNDLLLVNQTIQIEQITLQSTSPQANGIYLSNGSLSKIQNVQLSNFLNGLVCTGTGSAYVVNSCLCTGNSTGILINGGCSVAMSDCIIMGAPSIVGAPANTGVEITGAGSYLLVNGGQTLLCENAYSIINGAIFNANATIFRVNTYDIIQTTASRMILTGCSFELTTSSADVDIQISGSGTTAELTACDFNGNGLLGTPQATALSVFDDAFVTINATNISNYATALHIGDADDTSSTQASISSVAMTNCTIDIMQDGSSTLHCNGGSMSSSKLSINDPTNVQLAYFDVDSNAVLTIGSTADTNTTLIHAHTGTANNPSIDYRSSLYGAQAIGFTNPSSNASSWFVISNDDAQLAAITTDSTQQTSVRLVADEGSTVGGLSALRGWDIIKNGSSAELAFQYQNTITGQSIIAPYTILQLDGVTNHVQLPTTGTQLIFGGDTNLYRSAANVLKTDDNLIVDTLTPNRAVITDGTKQLASSTTTTTEIGFLSGTTSSIQTQINSKVAKAGDTMTGTLQLPAGTAAAPSLTFTGSTTTGLSATSDDLSFSTNGLERFKIAAGGTVSINGFATAGVVHNNASGNLSTSLIVNADIDASAGIVDTKLAPISTAGKVANSATTATAANTANAIVARDASGNFIAGTITANLNGNAATATTAATATSATNFTGSLSGDVTGTQGATVVGLVGGQTAANVAAGTALANAATSVNTPSTIVRRDASGNFAAGTITANLNGNATSATSATTATTATTATNFTGSLSGDVTGTQGATVVASVGGQTAANVAAGSTLANAATNVNTANTIVRRDASGNFAAGTITANLNGNATTATSASTATTATNFTGSLNGDVTGTQGATIVASVGGQTAANVAAGAALANAATSANTPSTIVRRDASGNFAAGTITANLNGNAATATTATSATTATTATNFTGSLSGDVTGTQGATIVSTVAGVTAANVAAGATLANAATTTNTANTIVRRDALGNFSAGVITANLNGNATTATTATTATNFSGSLSGDVTGTQGATVVALIDGETAANVASATVLTNAATALNTASAIVRRDTNGDFAAGIITADLVGNASTATTATTATNFSGPLSGDVTGTQGATIVASVGGQTAANVSSATLLANAATSTNTASTIVRRDASGNFAAGTITANLNGNATTATSATTATTATTATNFTGSLIGDVTGTQGATVVSTVGGQTASAVASATLLAAAATNLNTANTIVRREASGNFAAGTITANLNGNATTATSATTATTATTATNFTGSLSGDVTGTQGTTVVATVGGQTASNVAAATILANAATNANTPNTIVRRDASGNFTAGTITAALNGNAATATTAISATTATNFTGSLSGDVTGTQGATVVASVGGQTAANIAAGAALANAATSANTASTIVRRDASGNFVAGTITANLNGNATTATTATTATNFTGSLSGDITGTQGATVVSSVGGQTAANVAAATVLANAATNLNTASTLVRRDASGNFSAGVITATLNGNATTATSATTATTATNFTGSLTGDVTGTQSATVVASVGGQTAANVASATALANAATSANTANTIVRRDASGNFVAGTITANLSGNATTATTATNFTGSLSGDVTGTQGATVVASVGGQTATNVASATVLANAATSANTASTIVRRDASGNFVAGTITANLNGNASTATSATTATNFTGSLAGDVTGTQGATIVSSVGGQTAASVAAATVLANAATSTNTNNAIVRRDASGNFSATTITADSLNLTTSLILPNGTATSPSLNFIGSTTTGLSAPTANQLTISASGIAAMTVTSSEVKSLASRLVTANLFCNQGIQAVVPTSNGSVTASATTSILLLKPTGNVTNYTINFPGSPTNGQYFSIILGASAPSVAIVNGGNGATIVNGVTRLSTDGILVGGIPDGTAVSYIYYSPDNTWYRERRA